MEGLNAYLHYSLSSHTVFATAVCIRLEPSTGEMRWSSAGHPPVLLRRANGQMERLDSTGIMLGVMGPGEFVAGERSTRLQAGDSVLAYTDGAIEAQDRTGQMLRLRGFEQIVASSYLPSPGAMVRCGGASDQGVSQRPHAGRPAAGG
ncbi:MAG: serine/threonine-protein phosphatase, partial [Deltaproteobacteria bacterium]|nr:serine/threonine-protein phosphatase [Deltaproteobacteria bacterium]